MQCRIGQDGQECCSISQADREPSISKWLLLSPFVVTEDFSRPGHTPISCCCSVPNLDSSLSVRYLLFAINFFSSELGTNVKLVNQLIPSASVHRTPSQQELAGGTSCRLGSSPGSPECRNRLRSSSTGPARLGFLLDLPISFIACWWMVLLAAAVIRWCGPWYETKVTAAFLGPDLSSSFSYPGSLCFLNFRGILSSSCVGVPSKLNLLMSADVDLKEMD